MELNFQVCPHIFPPVPTSLDKDLNVNGSSLMLNVNGCSLMLNVNGCSLLLNGKIIGNYMTQSRLMS